MQNATKNFLNKDAGDTNLILDKQECPQNFEVSQNCFQAKLTSPLTEKNQGSYTFILISNRRKKEENSSAFYLDD